MIKQPRFILVDDNPDELMNLREALFSAGLPCLALQFKSNDENKGLDHYSLQENKQLKVLFTDLHLVENVSTDPKTYVENIAYVIRKITKTEPYLIIFWSKSSEGEEIINLLEERYSSSINMPIAWGALDKNTYIIEENVAKKEEIAKTLYLDINKIIESSPIFNSLINWEGRVSEAASESLESLCNLAKPQGKFKISSHIDNIKKLITVISHESIGLENALKTPTIAIDNGLFPILIDRVTMKRDFSTIDNLWKKSLNKLSEIHKLECEENAKLNSFYHIDLNVNEIKKDTQGVFVFANDKLGSTSQLNKYLGKSKNDLSCEFLNSAKKSKTHKYADAVSSLILGFIEVSADCDHAQNSIGLTGRGKTSTFLSDFSSGEILRRHLRFKSAYL